MSTAQPPLEVVRIAGGPLEIEVLPGVGARLHRLCAYGVDVLRDPDDPRTHVADPWFWGSYVMAPWCNRVAPGPIAVAGRTIDLAANFFDGTAIHGQVMARPWRSEGDGRFAIEGGDDGSGWPWRYDVRQTIRIDGTELALTVALTNQADGPMPGGVGFHPWFRRPVAVAIAARETITSNVNSPAQPVPVTPPFDRRRLEPMPDDLDATWAGLSDPPVVLDWPEAGIRATMSVTAPTLFIVAASPADKDAIAVEPQTHAPDGLRRLVGGEPGGLDLIEPGQTMTLTMRLTFSRPGVHATET
jgi:aldose 1-epimerase